MRLYHLALVVLMPGAAVVILPSSPAIDWIVERVEERALQKRHPAAVQVVASRDDLEFFIVDGFGQRTAAFSQASRGSLGAFAHCVVDEVAAASGEEDAAPVGHWRRGQTSHLANLGGAP